MYACGNHVFMKIPCKKITIHSAGKAMGRRRGDHNDAPEVPVQVIMLSNGEVRRYQHVDQRRLQDVGTVRSGDQPICWVLLRCACARLGPVRVLGWVLVRCACAQLGPVRVLSWVLVNVIRWTNTEFAHRQFGFRQSHGTRNRSSVVQEFRCFIMCAGTAVRSP